MNELRYTWKTFSREITLLLLGVAVFLPLYLLVAVSLKTTPDVYLAPLEFPLPPHWESYRAAATGSGTSISMITALINSTVVTVGSVLLLVALGSIAAYSIARRESRLGTALYFTFVLGIIIPHQLGLIPLYAVMRRMGLVDTHVGMMVLYAGLFLPLAVFLYTSFVRTLPRDYEESAWVDGASHVRTFTRVVFPLLLPATGTVTVLTSLVVWNDFFVQLIFLSGSDRVTLPVAVYSIASAQQGRWNIIFAAVVISVVPIVTFFVVAQRTMVRGFTGGLKG